MSHDTAQASCRERPWRGTEQREHHSTESSVLNHQRNQCNERRSVLSKESQDGKREKVKESETEVEGKGKG